MTEPTAEDDTAARAVPFISRVRLKNYKSIAACDVRLGSLTILVGPNGSGKSNFLDALAFLGRAVATTPGEAIEARGGLGEILRRVPEQANSFSIAVDITLPEEPGFPKIDAAYEFEIGPPIQPRLQLFEVIREECEVRSGGQTWRFHAKRGRTEIEAPDQRGGVAKHEPDRLYFLVASNQVPFAPIFAGIRGMQFFNFNPEVIRSPQSPTTGATLGLAGEHLSDVLQALASEHSGYKERIDAYMQAIIPGITSIEPDYSSRHYVTTLLRANTGSGGEEVEFGPESMSEGTVRAAAVLAALFQPWVLDGRVRLVGIEEPEIALHPAAAGVLFDALTEGSERVQVLGTSQSADLLDREDLDISVIRPVSMQDGLTIIGEVDAASREITEKRLYTLGELMRGNQLRPAPRHVGDREE